MKRRPPITTAQFEALVTRYERQAERNPAAFRRSVVLYAIRGYLAAPVLVAIIFVVAAGFAIMRVFNVSVKMFEFGFILGRGLWAGLFGKPEPPKQHLIDRTKFPEVYALVDEVARSLNALPVDEVRVDVRLNAAAIQVRRKRIVVIGLPVLTLFDVDELKSVIAHEIGHIERGHGVFASRVLRVRTAWNHAVELLRETRRDGSWVAAGVDRYLPRLSAMAIVLSRLAEREADAASRDVVGAEVAGRAIVKLYALTPAVGPACTKLLDRYCDDPDRLVGMYEMLAGQIAEDNGLADFQSNIRRQFDAARDPFASHPHPADRMAVFGRPADVESAVALFCEPDDDFRSAAFTLLGPRFGEIARDVAHEQIESSKKALTERAHAIQQMRDEVEAFENRDPDAPTSVEELLAAAYRLWSLGRHEEALELLLPVQEASPETIFRVAWMRAQMGDDRWVDDMQTVVDDPEFGLQACTMLSDYYTKIGDRNSANTYIDEARRIGKYHESAKDQRFRLAEDGEYRIHDLSADEVDDLRKRLGPLKGVKLIYVVRRKYGPDPRYDWLYIIVVYSFAAAPNRLRAKVREAIAGFRACTFFVVDRVPKSIAAIPGAMVWSKSSSKV